MPDNTHFPNKNNGMKKVNNQDLINTNKLMHEQPNQAVPIFDQNFQQNISREQRMSKGEIEGKFYHIIVIIVENEKADFSSGNTNLALSILQSNFKSRHLFYKHSSKFAIKYKNGRKFEYL